MLRTVASALFVALLLAAVPAAELACSSSAAKTCTAAESGACDNTYTECTNKAAAAADKVACQKCVDDYCNCYSACGNTCNKQQLSAACQ